MDNLPDGVTDADIERLGETPRCCGNCFHFDPCPKDCGYGLCRVDGEWHFEDGDDCGSYVEG